MTLDSIDWETLTLSQASRLIGAADRREQRLGRIWNDSGLPADEQAWLVAFKLWENLRVFVLCDERPSHEESAS